MTSYEIVFQKMVDRIVARDPFAWRQVLNKHLVEMKTGEYQPHFTACIVQQSPRRLNEYDAYALACIVASIREEKLGLALLRLPGTPRPDREAATNNEILRGLPRGYKAEVEAGNDHWGDGFLEWDRPMLFTTGPRSRVLLISEGSVPLEVGTTNSARTWKHLQQDAGLARWPYEFDIMGVFIRLDRVDPRRIEWTDRYFQEQEAADAYLGAGI